MIPPSARFAALAALMLWSAATAAEREPYTRTYESSAYRVTVEAEGGPVFTTDRWRVRHRLEAPAGTTLRLPDISRTLGPFRVVVRDAKAPRDTRGTWQWLHELVLEPVTVESGVLTLPPLVFSFEDATGEEGRPAVSLRVEEIRVDVVSVAPADADLLAPRDIAMPFDPRPGAAPSAARASRTHWLVVAFAGVCALAAAWALRRRGTAAEPQPQPLHCAALAALARLRAQGLPEQGRFDELYVAMTAILRHYVKERFDVDAPHRTTEEIATSARRIALAPPLAAALYDVLRRGDSVKFARRVPSDGEAAESLDAVALFFERAGDGGMRAPAGFPPQERG